MVEALAGGPRKSKNNDANIASNTLVRLGLVRCNAAKKEFRGQRKFAVSVSYHFFDL